MAFEDRLVLVALTDVDYLVRLRGIDALVARDPESNIPSEPGDPRFIEPLLELADDSTKNVRSAVAWTLGIIASTEAGNQAKTRLRIALESPSWRARFAAARSFASLRNEPFAPLVPLLNDDVESVRWAAASTLAHRNRALIGEPRTFDPGLLPPLLTALEDPAPTVRAAAIWGLEPDDSDAAYAALLAGLHDRDYRVRIWPSYTLRNKRAVPALIEALDDSFLWVRSNAARNLGTLGDERAVDPLIGQLRTKNRYMRREAARALSRIGDRRAVASLETLRDRSTTDWIKAAASEAIAEITTRA